MGTDFPFQQKLFEHVSAQFKSKKAELDALSSFFQLSRTAAYDRRSGKTPLTFDEGLALSKEFKFPLAEILPEIKHQFVFDSPTSLENSPKEYVQSLHHDLHKLLELGNGHLWHKTDDTPIFWLKHSRLLAAFKLYYWIRALSIYNNLMPPNFDENWITQPAIQEILDASREIRHCFEQIPSTEIWSCTMFDKTMAQIQNCVETTNINDKTVIHQLVEAIQSVIETMKTMARSQKKNTHDSGAMLNVFENRTFGGNNLLLGKTNRFSFGYVENGYPDFNRFTDAQIVDTHLLRVKMMLPHLAQLVGFSKNANSFFEHLDHRYIFWADKIEG